jgi:hypothetical protein
MAVWFALPKGRFESSCWEKSGSTVGNSCKMLSWLKSVWNCLGKIRPHCQCITISRPDKEHKVLFHSGFISILRSFWLPKRFIFSQIRRDLGNVVYSESAAPYVPNVHAMSCQYRSTNRGEYFPVFTACLKLEISHHGPFYRAWVFLTAWLALCSVPMHSMMRNLEKSWQHVAPSLNNPWILSLRYHVFSRSEKHITFTKSGHDLRHPWVWKLHLMSSLT